MDNNTPQWKLFIEEAKSNLHVASMDFEQWRNYKLKSLKTPEEINSFINMDNNDKGTWIYPLSDYQLGFLKSLFRYMEAPEPYNIEVTRVALSDKHDLIMEYKQYGILNVKSVAMMDTAETKGQVFPNFSELEKQQMEYFNKKHSHGK